MMDFFPKLSYQALSIVAKSLSEDKLQNPFLRLLPKDHVKFRFFLPNYPRSSIKEFRNLVRGLTFSSVNLDYNLF